MPIGLSDSELVALNAGLHKDAVASTQRARAGMTPEEAAADEFSTEASTYGLYLVATAPHGHAPRRSTDYWDDPVRHEYIRMRAEEIRQERAGVAVDDVRRITSRPMTAVAFIAHNAATTNRYEAAVRIARSAMTPEDAAADEFTAATVEHEQRKVAGVPTDQCSSSQSLEEVLNSQERHTYVSRRAEEIRQERAGVVPAFTVMRRCRDE
jgi:hypothetical protein